MAHLDVDISMASLLVSVVTAIFMGYISFVMLKFSAKPKLRIRLLGDDSEASVPGEVALTLRAHLENVGYWYAKPRATNTSVYWNFDPDFELFEIRYGSDLGKTENNVRKGKGGSKYLKAKGIHLSAGEPGEDIEVDVKTPTTPGLYRGWVSAFCDEGDCGIHSFSIRIM